MVTVRGWMAVVLAAAAVGVGINVWGQEMGAATQAGGEARKLAVVDLGNPRSVAVDGAGNLYVVDVTAEKVIKITKAGQGKEMDGPGMGEIATPIGVWSSKEGELVVADLDNNKVYVVSPKGEAKVVGKASAAGAAGTDAPAEGVMDSKGNVFVADNKNATVLKITPGGEVTVFAGQMNAQGATDGKGGEARFNMPRGLAIDGKDNLYVADEGNSNIRKITPEGEVTTLAGGTEAAAADGKGAEARFAAPRAVAASADGTVYVADTDNHTVRKVTPAGEVTTIAGKAGDAGDADGGAGASRLNSPRGVAVDEAGNVFVADSENGAVREIVGGEVRTVVRGK